VDPLAEKFPGRSLYEYTFSNPVRFDDPDGRAPKDVIILGNSAGAGGVGHQAILVGNDKKGWIYISKVGAAKSGGAYGQSRYTIKQFKSVDEFKNSAHNFEVIDGTNHSKIGCGEESNMIFKLDENGNKIQRYDQSYRIDTDDRHDMHAASMTARVAKDDYCLTMSDCSDIPTAFLNNARDLKGNRLKNGEGKTIFSDAPNTKQRKIESRNEGTDYDSKVRPTTNSLQKGEQGKKEVSSRGSNSDRKRTPL